MVKPEHPVPETVRSVLLNDVSDHDGSGLLICPKEIPDEEVAGCELRPLFIHGNANMKRTLSRLSLLNWLKTV